MSIDIATANIDYRPNPRTFVHKGISNYIFEAMVLFKQGVNGEAYIEGCVKHTCKKGVWRPSIDKSTCCFNGEAFEFGSRISTVDDDCTTVYLECTDNGIETVISISPHCSPAKKIQVDQIKDLLKQKIKEAGITV